MNDRRWIAGLGTVSFVLLLLLVWSWSHPSAERSGSSGLSQTSAKHSATLITTSATATRHIENTVVDISVGVEAADRDLPSAQRTLTAKTNTLMQYLHAQNVERLRTDGLSFTPDDRYRKNGPDRTVAYNGSVSVSFRTTSEKASVVLAGVLANGASSIGNTVFLPADEQTAKMRDELSSEATRTALSQAEAIAKASGGHVLTVISVNTQGEPGAITPEPMEMTLGLKAADKPVAPPIATAAGDRELSVHVELVVAAARD